MKTLDELYREVLADDSLKNEYMEAEKNGGIEDFLKSHGCNASAEEFGAFITALEDENGEASHGELTDDELDNVSAGKRCGTRYDNGRPIVGENYVCGKFYCKDCVVPYIRKGIKEYCPKCGLITKCPNCYYLRIEVTNWGKRYRCYNPKRYNN